MPVSRLLTTIGISVAPGTPAVQLRLSIRPGIVEQKDPGTVTTLSFPDGTRPFAFYAQNQGTRGETDGYAAVALHHALHYPGEDVIYLATTKDLNTLKDAVRDFGCRLVQVVDGNCSGCGEVSLRQDPVVYGADDENTGRGGRVFVNAVKRRLEDDRYGEYATKETAPRYQVYRLERNRPDSETIIQNESGQAQVRELPNFYAYVTESFGSANAYLKARTSFQFDENEFAWFQVTNFFFGFLVPIYGLDAVENHKKLLFACGWAITGSLGIRPLQCRNGVICSQRCGDEYFAWHPSLPNLESESLHALRTLFHKRRLVADFGGCPDDTVEHSDSQCHLLAVSKTLQDARWRSFSNGGDAFSPGDVVEFDIDGRNLEIGDQPIGPGPWFACGELLRIGHAMPGSENLNRNAVVAIEKIWKPMDPYSSKEVRLEPIEEITMSFVDGPLRTVNVRLRDVRHSPTQRLPEDKRTPCVGRLFTPAAVEKFRNRKILPVPEIGVTQADSGLSDRVRKFIHCNKTTKGRKIILISMSSSMQNLLLDVHARVILSALHMAVRFLFNEDDVAVLFMEKDYDKCLKPATEPGSWSGSVLKNNTWTGDAFSRVGRVLEEEVATGPGAQDGRYRYTEKFQRLMREKLMADNAEYQKKKYTREQVKYLLDVPWLVRDGTDADAASYRNFMRAMYGMRQLRGYVEVTKPESDQSSSQEFEELVPLQIDPLICLLQREFGQTNDPRFLLVTDTQPFSELLNHTDFVVFHGGNGVRHELVARSIPALVMPHGFDQHAVAKASERYFLSTQVQASSGLDTQTEGVEEGELCDVSVDHRYRVGFGQREMERILSAYLRSGCTAGPPNWSKERVASMRDVVSWGRETPRRPFYKADQVNTKVSHSMERGNKHVDLDSLILQEGPGMDQACEVVEMQEHLRRWDAIVAGHVSQKGFEIGTNYLVGQTKPTRRQRFRVVADSEMSADAESRGASATTRLFSTHAEPLPVLPGRVFGHTNENSGYWGSYSDSSETNSVFRQWHARRYWWDLQSVESLSELMFIYRQSGKMEELQMVGDAFRREAVENQGGAMEQFLYYGRKEER